MDLNRSCEPELCLICDPHGPPSTGTTLGQQGQKGSDASLAGSSLAELPPPYERAINKVTSAHTLLNLHSSSSFSGTKGEWLHPALPADAGSQPKARTSAKHLR